ncbi:MAG TPA: ankyrin repeat domain-containing protein [Polyangiaceae bacterium]|nr:ankyrin repeat domain-containing protein [Polyangiaceae bacterium]
MVGIEHRRLLDAKAPLRLGDSGIFARIGGQAAIDRMVDVLYDRFDADSVLRPLFGSDLVGERANQKRFFAEWMGAGDQYSQAAHGSLKHRHDRLPITKELAGRWLGHLRRALEAVVLPEEDRAIIFSHAQAMAFALVNEEDSAGRRSKKQRSQGYVTDQASELARKGDLPGLRALSQGNAATFSHSIKAAIIMQAAALAGRTEVVTWLLESGIDRDKPHYLPINLAGAAFERVLFVTPLCAARLKRRTETARALMDRGAKDDLFTAAFLGDVRGIDEQLASHSDWAQVADPAADVLEITPLHHAVAGGHPAAVRAILSSVSGPVRGSLRALRSAAAQGSLEMVTLLLDRGASAEGLGHGRWVMDEQIAPLLARAGASVRGAQHPWVRASCTGNHGQKDEPDFVRALLKYGAKVDDRYAGATPLHYAAKAGFVGSMKVLLDHSADANALDDDGLTPLQWIERAAKTVDRDSVWRVLRGQAPSGAAPPKARGTRRR